jgi:hypothetical protein
VPVDETEIRALADELEIRKLVARYADAVTRYDPDAWIETWAADGCWNLAGKISEGHEGLRTTFTDLVGLFERVIQLPQDGILGIEGDRGTGRWSMIELGRSLSGAPSLTVGTYRDIYRREESGWRFGERHFDFIYTGPPDLTGAWLG